MRTVFAVVAAAVTLLQLTRPGLLFGVTPDVSVYLGGAVRLVHGVVPYRDFVFVQPPGFVLLATPFAFLSELTGTRDALAVLRLLMPVLAAADVLMVGRLVRGSGAAATAAACAVVALFPAELYALRGPQLEPLVVTLCLAGALLVFGEERAGRGRLALGGAAFGLAVAVKLTALLPLLVLFVVLGALARRRVPAVAGGALVGAAVPTLPFLLLAPAAFLRDTVATALGRVPAGGRAPLAERLGDLTGVSIVGGADGLSVVVAVAVVAMVVATLVTSRHKLTELEWFALGSTGLVGIAQVLPALYYPQYAALVTPFLAVTVAATVARLRVRAVASGATTVLAAALLAVEVAHVSAESVPDVAAQVDAVVPAGACAISESPVFLFTSDRFQSSTRTCPALTDPEGTALALGSTPEAVALWRSTFAHADAIVSAIPIAAWGLPNRAAIPSYVRAHFTSVGTGPLVVYVRHGARP